MFLAVRKQDKKCSLLIKWTLINAALPQDENNFVSPGHHCLYHIILAIFQPFFISFEKFRGIHDLESKIIKAVH